MPRARDGGGACACCQRGRRRESACGACRLSGAPAAGGSPAGPPRLSQTAPWSQTLQHPPPQHAEGPHSRRRRGQPRRRRRRRRGARILLPLPPPPPRAAESPGRPHRPPPPPVAAALAPLTHQSGLACLSSPFGTPEEQRQHALTMQHPRNGEQPHRASLQLRGALGPCLKRGGRALGRSGAGEALETRASCFAAPALQAAGKGHPEDCEAPRRGQSR
mmetsp:Transcript_5781/g.24388  ORF Transcript_5781/g.24388 Transcript_5781/m.24388 type:complete len:219 (-) Transcript_5781:28-684(-)